MKRLCLGTLLTILYQARNNSKVTNDVLCSCIFKAFGADFANCGSTSGHLKSGHDNVPGGLKTAAEKRSFEETDIGFQNEVVKNIKNVKKESVIRAIKSILDEDDTIKDYTVVGYIHGYEKRNLIEMPKVSFSAVLASVFYFAITEVKDDCLEAIKEIDKDFVESFDDSDIPIYFESSDAEQVLPLTRSLYSGHLILSEIFVRLLIMLLTRLLTSKIIMRMNYSLLIIHVHKVYSDRK